MRGAGLPTFPARPAAVPGMVPPGNRNQRRRVDYHLALNFKPESRKRRNRESLRDCGSQPLEGRQF